MPAFLSDFAAWRARRNKERADRLIHAAADEARILNERAEWWNRVRAWLCGLGPWPGLPQGSLR